MRSWSEEKRPGTIESLLTSPVSKFTLIGGKFAAALSLVLIAMVLTLPLPLTVSVLGRLDIGPVFGGYVATFFLRQVIFPSACIQVLKRTTRL